MITVEKTPEYCLRLLCQGLIESRISREMSLLSVELYSFEIVLETSYLSFLILKKEKKKVIFRFLGICAPRRRLVFLRNLVSYYFKSSSHWLDRNSLCLFAGFKNFSGGVPVSD